MALKIDQEYLLLAIDKNDGSKSFINLALTTSFYFRVILDLLDSFFELLLGKWSSALQSPLKFAFWIFSKRIFCVEFIHKRIYNKFIVREPINYRQKNFLSSCFVAIRAYLETITKSEDISGISKIYRSGSIDCEKPTIKNTGKLSSAIVISTGAASMSRNTSSNMIIFLIPRVCNSGSDKYDEWSNFILISIISNNLINPRRLSLLGIMRFDY